MLTFLLIRDNIYLSQNITKESGEMYMKKRTRRLCAVLLSLLIAIQMVPLAIAAPGQVEPMEAQDIAISVAPTYGAAVEAMGIEPRLKMTTEAEVGTANSGDEFMVNVTISRRQAAGDIGLSGIVFLIYYDTTRLELLPQGEWFPGLPRWAVHHPGSDSLAQQFMLPQTTHNPQDGWLNIFMESNIGGLSFFDDVIVSLHFRVRDDALSGEVIISHDPWGGAVGRVLGIPWPQHSMPIMPADPLTDFARVSINPPTTHTVTFELHGGWAPAGFPGVFDSQTVIDGETATTPPVEPVRRGDNYKFIGWSTDLVGGTLFDFSTPITENTLLHAQWTQLIAPMLEMNTEARVGTATPGDEFVVDITIEVLEEAGSLGWTLMAFQIYYDSTRLELIPYRMVGNIHPQWALFHQYSHPFAQWGFLGVNPQPQLGRVHFLVETFQMLPIVYNDGFGDGIMSIRFRVRDDAPAGEAVISYSLSDSVGSEVGSTSMHYMPVRPANPLTDFARVLIP